MAGSRDSILLYNDHFTCASWCCSAALGQGNGSCTSWCLAMLLLPSFCRICGWRVGLPSLLNKLIQPASSLWPASRQTRTNWPKPRGVAVVKQPAEGVQPGTYPTPAPYRTCLVKTFLNNFDIVVRFRSAIAGWLPLSGSSGHPANYKLRLVYLYPQEQ